LFYDPLVCVKINAGILAYLREHGMKSVSELVGSLRTTKDLQDTPLAG
jgi:dihydroorotate dehydrogenase (NAD+) catalytic subunit